MPRIKNLRDLANAFGGVITGQGRITVLTNDNRKLEALYESAHKIGAGVASQETILVKGYAIIRVNIAIAS